MPKEDERHALSRYLSELTLMDEHGFEICLPQMDIPNGFHLIHKRCSRRSLYEFNDGFAVILSRESSWRSDVAAEESRESVLTYHVALNFCRFYFLRFSSGCPPKKVPAKKKKLPQFFFRTNLLHCTSFM